MRRHHRRRPLPPAAEEVSRILLPKAEKRRLTAQINDAVTNIVLPAYKQFAAWTQTDYIPYGRAQLSIESLPEGKKRYQNDIHRLTTTNLTPCANPRHRPQRVRPHCRRDDRTRQEERLPRPPQLPQSHRIRPQIRPALGEDQIVDDFRHYIAQMRPKLPELFTVIPAAPVTVEPIPAFQAAAATHYQSGTPDGKRPGRVSVAVSPITRSAR